MRLLIRLVITALALYVAVRIVPGLGYEGGALGMLGVALVFGLVNAFVRPVLKLLTCPLILLTMGLFTFVLNALLFLLTAAIANALGIDFHVGGFWPALWGSIIVSVVSFILSVFVRERD